MIDYPNISPEIISIGPLKIRWYGLMYVLAYLIGFRIGKKRVEGGLFKINYRALEAWVTYLVVGMLIGARFAYVFLYNWDYYSEHLIEIFYIWQGGLAFHGAAAGMIVACALFARRFRLPFYQVTDSLAYVAPPGLGLGRIGNFINGELWGRASDAPWAMIFPGDPLKIPRHPSQIYQALTEGLLLGLILWGVQRIAMKKDKLWSGLVGGTFLLGYGVLRFCTEFAREPDAQLGFVLGSLSMGQLLCLIMVAAGIFVLWHSSRTQPSFTPKAADPKFLGQAEPASNPK